METLLIGLLAGLVIGYLACMFTWKPYWTIEEKIKKIEDNSPHIKDYAEMYQKVDLIIEYLGIVKEAPKPRFIRNASK